MADDTKYVPMLSLPAEVAALLEAAGECALDEAGREALLTWCALQLACEASNRGGEALRVVELADALINLALDQPTRTYGVAVTDDQGERWVISIRPAPPKTTRS